MDYVFRGFYQRSSSGSRSSNYTCISHQANQCDVESYNYDHFLRNRDVMMERQLDKEMIRREILAEKAAMRRELEAQVRRELREEREMEVRLRGGEFWGASERNYYAERRSFEKRVALPLQGRIMYDFPHLEEGTIVRERMNDFPRLEGRGYEREEEVPLQRATSSRSYDKEELPFQRAPQAIISEVKPPLDVEKKQVISLANHPGKKRKNMSSPIEGPSEVTKKLTKEWTCALCQVSATSELGLEDHLKGKKHKSKQAGKKAGMIGLCSKKINNAPNLCQVVESVELEKSKQILNNHETGVENNEIDVVMEKGCGGADLKMPNKKKMKFKFYCKICEVGAFSEDVMANHNKGKKHLRLQLGAKR